MLIRCPECLFERQVDLSKIPPTAQLATCPKCRFKFRFREYVVDIPDVVSPVESMEVQDSPYVHPALRDGEEQVAHGHHASPEHEAGSVHAAGRDAAYADDVASAYDERETAPEVAPDAPAETDYAHEGPDEHAAAAEVEYVVRRSAVSPASPVSPVSSVAESRIGEDDYSADSDAYDASVTHDAPEGDDAEEDVAATDTAQAAYAARSTQDDDSDDAAAYGEETVYTVIRPHGDADMQQYDGGGVSDAPDMSEQRAEQAREQAHEQAAPASSKPHRHLGTISDFEDHGGKGDIWDAIAAMGDGDHSGVSAFIRHSSVEMQIPWENRGKLGLFAAWRKTLGLALFSPSSFFGCIQGAGGFAAPFLFFLFIALLSVGLETGSLSLLHSLWGESLTAAGIVLPAASAEGLSLGSVALGLFGYAFGRLMIMTIVCHLLLRLVFSRCKSFATTFRVMAYSSAAGLLGVLPLAGSVGAQLWFLILAIVGLRQAHEADWKQAILAVLPVFVLILVAVFWFVGVGSGTAV
jgi:hypothetical protein